MSFYHSLSQRTEGHGQTVDFIEHGVFDFGSKKTDKHTVRVRIHDDSHASQAFGVVERWDSSQWREVASVRGDALRVEHGIGYRTSMKDALLFAFAVDRQILLDLAQEVLRER